jgi:hypothetical protein
VELGAAQDGADALREDFAERYGLDVRPGRSSAVASHGIMHRRLHLEVHPCRLHRGRVASVAELRWVDPERLADVPVSGATRKILRLIR